MKNKISDTGLAGLATSSDLVEQYVFFNQRGIQ
jgi:hypothetical protein